MPPEPTTLERAKLTKQALEAIVFMAEQIEDRGKHRCEHPAWFNACVLAGQWAREELWRRKNATHNRHARRERKAAGPVKPRGVRQIVFAPEGE